GRKLRSVQKASGPDSIDRDEIPELRAAHAEGDVLAPGSKRSPDGFQSAERALPQAGLCGGVHHQTRLVAVLRLGSAGNDLHALNRVGGELRGKYLTLLIADVLSIDDIAHLRVVARGMKKSVRVARRRARTVINHAAQPGGGIENRQFGKRVGVDVGMR